MVLVLLLLQAYLLLSLEDSDAEVQKFLKQRRGNDPRPAFLAAQVYRLKKWSLVCLCLLSVLCARISYLQAEEATVEKCTEYFTEILKIQKTRQLLQHGADEMMRRYKSGNLTKIELDSTLHVWYITESRLREQGTEIYDVAYEQKCFDEELNESRRTQKGNAP
jgi:hypothetical protein